MKYETFEKAKEIEQTLKPILVLRQIIEEARSVIKFSNVNGENDGMSYLKGLLKNRPRLQERLKVIETVAHSALTATVDAIVKELNDEFEKLQDDGELNDEFEKLQDDGETNAE